MPQLFAGDVHGCVAPGAQLPHKLSGGVLALQEPHAPLLLQVSVPEFVMPQLFAADVHGCVAPGAQPPPDGVTVTPQVAMST
jgi:hypothetical protein